MINLKNLTQNLFLLFVFSPIISYFTLNLFGKSTQFIFGIVFLFVGLVYLMIYRDKIVIPKFAVWLLLFIVYEYFIFFLGKFGFSHRLLTAALIYNKHIHVLFTIIIIYNTRFDDLFIKKVVKLFKTTVLISVVVSVIQVFDINFFDGSSIFMKDNVYSSLMRGDMYTDRRHSIFSFIDLNEIGLSYMPLISVLVGYMLMKNQNKWLPLFLIMGGLTALLTNTRYVMVAFVILLFQVPIFKRLRFKGVIKYLIYIVIIFFVVSNSLKVLGYNIDEWYQKRLFAEQSVDKSSRYEAFATFGIFFIKAPILGTGGMTNDIRTASAAVGSSQIHIGYLSSLVYYGIVGSFFLFGFWYSLARYLFRNARKTQYWGSFFAFLLFLWANVTLVTFHIFFYGIIFALVFDKAISEKSLSIRG